VTVRRLVVVLLLLVAVAAVLDRVAVAAAERTVADRIRQDQGLGGRPDVTIHGFPFLTQLVSGDYDDVDLTVRNLGGTGVIRVERLTAHLTGTHVAFGDVVRRDVDRVPIDRAVADVVVGIGDVNSFLSRDDVRITAAEGRKVHVAATVAGVEIDADVPVTVDSGDLLLSLPGGTQIRLPLPDLPFGVRLESVAVSDGQIVVTGSARDLVLRT
jgi:hypothetical protein